MIAFVAGISEVFYGIGINGLLLQMEADQSNLS